MRRIVSLLTIVLVALARPPEPAAGAPLGTCWAPTDDNDWSGQREFNTPTYGIQATINFIDESLCINTGNMGLSFSTSWVAVSAVDDPADIYQIGFIKCQNVGCPSGTRWMYAYGHEAGACGALDPPDPFFLTAASGIKTYKIDRVYQTGIGWTYAAYVDSSMKNWRIASDLDTCWPPFGPRAWFVSNEVADASDQSGGEVNPHQHFTSIRYRGNGAWLVPTMVSGIPCNMITSDPQACVHDSVTHDAIHTWDERVP